MRCKRRDETMGLADKNFPGEDTWRDDRGHKTCSYCGSLHPGELFAALEAEACEITPTDKSYKIYVELANPLVGQPCIVSSSMGPAVNAFGEPTRDDLTEEEKAANRYRRDTWGVENQRHEMKFYFQHLDEAQQQRFIDVLNAKKMKLKYPGYFYVAPYFITFKPPTP